ncbi:MAG: insulinase family protein [Oscillospiraceae bacterium]|nr:insulinase family protein [Oscillospiraceae bacterium]
MNDLKLMAGINLKEYAKIGERVYSGKLPNGLSVFVVPKRGFHKSYAYFATDYGGADRRFRLGDAWIDTPEGVAHFLEHKMFDTEDGNALTALSANGASPNAYTSTDITAYHFESIEKFSENLELLLSFVSIPYFTAESVEKEQGIISQEIQMVEDDPDYCLYYGLMKSIFRHNPLRDSVAGTIESISKITAETLYDCHKVFYNPSNMALCVVGDVEPSKIFEIAEQTLPKEPADVPERDYGPLETLQPDVARFESAMEVSLPIFLAGCKAKAATRGPDSLRLELTSALALDLLAGQSSPLYLRLYSEGLICSDFSASFESAAGAAYSMFGGETRDPESVLREIKKEIVKLTASGLDKGLFERTKKAALGSQIRSLNSFDAICAGIVGGHFRGYDAFDSIELLSTVTEDDIIAFYNENLSPDNMAISIISPKGR